MRCPRCTKKVNRKAWKFSPNCAKCNYSGFPCNDILYSFPTNKYIVYIENKESFVYQKKSDRDIFVCYDGGYKLYRFDAGEYVGRINKRLRRDASDEDVDKYLMLMC